MIKNLEYQMLVISSIDCIPYILCWRVVMFLGTKLAQNQQFCTIITLSGEIYAQRCCFSSWWKQNWVVIKPDVWMKQKRKKCWAFAEFKHCIWRNIVQQYRKVECDFLMHDLWIRLLLASLLAKAENRNVVLICVW